jgi:hypothetical protein
MKGSDIIQTIAAIMSLAMAASTCANGTVQVGAGTGEGGTSGSIGGAGGAGTSQSPGSGTITIPDAAIGGSPASNTSVDAQVVACTDGGDCICPTLSVAVVGKPGIWGSGTDTAFQDWLNSNSAGTARVDNYLTKPVFTPDFLAAYNLLIFAGFGDDSNNGPWWTFSATEIAAFQDWIENKGGGVISLAGYSGDSKEISAKNALLAFSGISYQDQNTNPSCLIAKCHYECGNPSAQLNEWNKTDPVIANLSFGVKMIGIDGGHPINAPADAHVAVMTTTATGNVQNWLVGKVTGKGRVLVYADEWITYTAQWDGHDAQYANDPTCKGLLPQDLYQTAQFWYDMIRWTQPNGNCFTIVDPQQPVTIW